MFIKNREKIMDAQIQLLLQQLVSTEKITDAALESFGANISSIITNYTDEELLPILEVIRTSLLIKNSQAYDLQEDNYERIIISYVMRGVFHAIRLDNKEHADLLWTRMSNYFKSKLLAKPTALLQTMHENHVSSIEQPNPASIGSLETTEK